MSLFSKQIVSSPTEYGSDRYYRPYLPQAVSALAIPVSPLKGMVLIEFDNILGPVVAAQYPSGLLSNTVAKTCAELVLSSAEMAHHTLTIDLQEHTILTLPIVINNRKYYRNSFFFSFGFIFDRCHLSSIQPYIPIIRQVSHWACIIESDCGLLQGQTAEMVKYLINMSKRTFTRNTTNDTTNHNISTGSRARVPHHKNTTTSSTHHRSLGPRSMNNNKNITKKLQFSSSPPLSSHPTQPKSNLSSLLDSNKTKTENIVASMTKADQSPVDLPARKASPPLIPAVSPPTAAAPHRTDTPRRNSSITPFLRLATASTMANYDRIMTLFTSPQAKRNIRQALQSSPRRHLGSPVKRSTSSRQSPRVSTLKTDSSTGQLTLSHLPLRKYVLDQLASLLLFQLPRTGSGVLALLDGAVLSIQLPIPYTVMIPPYCEKPDRLWMHRIATNAIRSLLSSDNTSHGKVTPPPPPSPSHPLTGPPIIPYLFHDLSLYNDPSIRPEQYTIGSSLRISPQAFSLAPTQLQTKHSVLSQPSYNNTIPSSRHDIIYKLIEGNLQSSPVYHHLHNSTSPVNPLDTAIHIPQSCMTRALRLYSTPIRTSLITLYDPGQSLYQSQTPLQTVLSVIDDNTPIFDIIRRCPSIPPPIIISLLYTMISHGSIIIIDHYRPENVYIMTSQWSRYISMNRNAMIYNNNSNTSYISSVSPSPSSTFYKQAAASSDHEHTSIFILSSPLSSHVSDSSLQSSDDRSTPLHSKQQPIPSHISQDKTLFHTCIETHSHSTCHGVICTSLLKQALMYSTVLMVLSQTHFGLQQQPSSPITPIAMARLTKFIMALDNRKIIPIHQLWSQYIIPRVSLPRLITFLESYGIIQRVNIGLSLRYDNNNNLYDDTKSYLRAPCTESSCSSRYMISDSLPRGQVPSSNCSNCSLCMMALANPLMPSLATTSSLASSYSDTLNKLLFENSIGKRQERLDQRVPHIDINSRLYQTDTVLRTEQYMSSSSSMASTPHATMISNSSEIASYDVPLDCVDPIIDSVVGIGISNDTDMIPHPQSQSPMFESIQYPMMVVETDTSLIMTPGSRLHAIYGGQIPSTLSSMSYGIGIPSHPLFSTLISAYMSSLSIQASSLPSSMFPSPSLSSSFSCSHSSTPPVAFALRSMELSAGTIPHIASLSYLAGVSYDTIPDQWSNQFRSSLSSEFLDNPSPLLQALLIPPGGVSPDIIEAVKLYNVPSSSSSPSISLLSHLTQQHSLDKSNVSIPYDHSNPFSISSQGVSSSIQTSSLSSNNQRDNNNSSNSNSSSSSDGYHPSPYNTPLYNDIDIYISHILSTQSSILASMLYTPQYFAATLASHIQYIISSCYLNPYNNYTLNTFDLLLNPNIVDQYMLSQQQQHSITHTTTTSTSLSPLWPSIASISSSLSMHHPSSSEHNNMSSHNSSLPSTQPLLVHIDTHHYMSISSHWISMFILPLFPCSIVSIYIKHYLLLRNILHQQRHDSTIQYHHQHTILIYIRSILCILFQSITMRYTSLSLYELSYALHYPCNVLDNIIHDIYQHSCHDNNSKAISIDYEPYSL